MSAWQIALVVYAAGCVLATWLVLRVFSLVSRDDEPKLLLRPRREQEREREDQLVNALMGEVSERAQS